MKTIVYTIILLGLILSSCEKESNLETPAYSPKLVIHAFISPADTILKVHVSANKNVFGVLKEYPETLPAHVFMFDGDERIEFSSMDKLGFCSSSYKILPGKEYRLLVQCAGYPDATAVCNVPELKNLDINIDTTSKFIEYYYDPTYPQTPSMPKGYIYWEVKVKFQDISGEPNFYNIGASFTYTRSEKKQTFPIYPSNNDDSEHYSYDFNASKILSDNLLDGKLLSITFKNQNSTPDTGVYNLDINAIILETDADYYKYHTSLMKYSSTDEPFTEYSPVYTNINGGLGIFASYNRYKKILKVK